MLEQVPISCLDCFQHLLVRLKAYGMDCQFGAASVQTVDPGGQAMTFWTCSGMLLLRGQHYLVLFLHFYFVSFFILTNVFL